MTNPLASPLLSTSERVSRLSERLRLYARGRGETGLLGVDPRAAEGRGVLVAPRHCSGGEIRLRRTYEQPGWVGRSSRKPDFLRVLIPVGPPTSRDEAFGRGGLLVLG